LSVRKTSFVRRPAVRRPRPKLLKITSLTLAVSFPYFLSVEELGSPYLGLRGAFSASLRHADGSEYKMYLRGRKRALATVITCLGKVMRKCRMRLYPLLQFAPGMARRGVRRIERGQFHAAIGAHSSFGGWIDLLFFHSTKVLKIFQITKQNSR